MNNISLFLVRNTWWLIPAAIIFSFWEESFPILLMLVFAFLGTIILSPIVDNIEKIIKNYKASVISVVATSIVLLILLFSFLIPFIGNQLSALQSSLAISKLPDLQYKIASISEKIFPEFIHNYLNDSFFQSNSQFAAIWEMGLAHINSFLSGASTIVFALGSAFLTFLFIIVFTIIFLIERKKFIKLFLHAIPIKYYASAKRIIEKIAIQIYSYIRGQLLAAISVAITSILGLVIFQWITGVIIPYTFLIGFAAGLFNLIPFVGPIAGMLPAIIIYLITDQVIPVHIVYVLSITGIFAVVQLIDNLIVSPYIMGESIGFHPILVIILVLFGAAIGGILGMLFIIPAAAILRVFIVEITENIEK